MAWVSRTTRDQNRVGFVPNQTPSHVGPGLYKPASSFKKKNPSFAPFASTSYRGKGGSTADGGGVVATPGPGAYSRGVLEPQGVDRVGGRRVAVETPFMSFTDRFRPPPASENPGPGQYKAPGAFDRAKKKRAGGGVAAAKDQAPAVTWVRVPTAPSIPAPGQSYGYEEGRYGELTMQQPPDGGHTGRPGDTAGPADYDVSRAADRRSNVRSAPGIDFSRSRTRRTDFSASFVPGPGAYADALLNTTSMAARAGVDGLGVAADSMEMRGGSARQMRRPPRRSAAFASRTARDGPAAKKAADGPGPGQYKAPSAFKKKKVPARQQFFGSTARRFDDPGKRKRGSGSAGPGPGSYMSQTMPATTSTGRRGGGPASRHVGFASTANRFAGPSSSQKPTPGAGTYDPTNTLAREARKKLESSARNGVFGSTEKRFYKPPSGLEVPGPGAYSKDPKVSRRTADMQRKPSSMFASEAVRFHPAAPPGAPDPGTYDTTKSWYKKSHARGPGLVASGPERFGAGGIISKDSVQAPGPGQYEAQSSVVRTGLAGMPNRRGVMIAGSTRFQPTVPDAVPGPGSYDADYVYDGMHKRTFNMSIAEQEAGW